MAGLENEIPELKVVLVIAGDQEKFSHPVAQIEINSCLLFAVPDRWRMTRRIGWEAAKIITSPYTDAAGNRKSSFIVDIHQAHLRS